MSQSNGPSSSASSSTPTPLANGQVNGTLSPSTENQKVSKRTLPLKLYQAAMQCDVDHFIQVLEETSAELKLTLSKILELVSPAGNTLLHVATREKKEIIARLLAYQSPSLLLRQNLAGNTALHVVVTACDLNVSRTLVYYAVDSVGPRARNKPFAGVTAIPGRRKLLRIRNNKGNLAFHEYAINGLGWKFDWFMASDPEICYFLNNEGKSPLYYAAEAATRDQGYWDFISIINTLKGTTNMKEMLKAVKGESPLLPAITARNKDVLDRIISAKPTFVNLLDEEGKTALHLAVPAGSIDIVKYLLAKDVECSLKNDNNGFFPIHIAAAHGHLQIVKELLQHYPDTREMLTRNGQNILHIAAATGKTKVVCYIVKNPSLGSLINETDYNGSTPLHLATINWHPMIVSTFTWDKRVNVSAINNQGFTALDAAEYYMEQPASFDRRLTWTVLKAAKAPRAPKKDNLNLYPLDSTLSRTSNTSHTDNYKDRVNKLLLVATLVATITFAAGFTMSGGYNNSDLNEGMATMLKKRAFYVFVFSDTIALYSSILVDVSLIWAQLGDVKLVHTALRLAIPLLGVSLAMMSLAFMAGVYLVVSTLNWLAYSVLIMGLTFLCAHLVIYFPLCFPITSGNCILRYISYYPLQLLIFLTTGDKNDDA